MDFLLSHLETAKTRDTYTNAVLYRTSINLGWIKLDQYYAKTDADPAYIMAVFLHPHYCQHWFEAHWNKADCDTATAVAESAYATAKKRYNTLVPRRTPPVLACKEMDAYAAHCNVNRRAHMDDDLYRWRHEEQAHHEVNPVAWWQANHQNYPILGSFLGLQRGGHCRVSLSHLHVLTLRSNTYSHSQRAPSEQGRLSRQVVAQECFDHRVQKRTWQRRYKTVLDPFDRSLFCLEFKVKPLVMCSDMGHEVSRCNPGLA
jgi:hypothetical protein